MRFLGLSLKILFHKNKEIKRMLSKKMAFSLMSLITIFALAFVASPALAQFGVGLSIADDNGLATNETNANNGDVSAADGFQVERADVVINVKFDKVVQLHYWYLLATDNALAAIKVSTVEANDFEIIAYNMFGGTVTAVVTDFEISNADPSDGQNFELTIPSQGPDAVRVIVAIKKGAVELADPRAELKDDGTRKDAGKNNAGHIEFHYVHSVAQ